MSFTVRVVENTRHDLEMLTRFCHELAEFDGHKATFDADKLKQNLFHPQTNVRAFFGLRQNEAIGFILSYECFTVYHGERGLYVPGAYIIETYRHLGYGVRLFKFLANYALENGFDFINWIVEENNEKANAIYRKMGAQISDGWRYVRIPKNLLETIASKKSLR